MCIERKRDRVVVFWEHFQAYHSARVRSLISRSNSYKMEVFPVSLERDGSCFHRTELAPDIKESVRVIWNNGGRSRKNIFSRIFGIWKVLDEISPSVVFTPGYVGVETFASILWAKLNRRATVLMFETLAHDRERFFVREQIKSLIVRQYDGAITGGSLGVEYLKQLGLAGTRIRLGYDSIDNEYFSALAKNIRANELFWRSNLKLPPRYFLAVGRMIEKKGFSWLVEVYAKYKEIYLERAWPLVIVGDGPEMDNVRGKIERLALEDEVILVGYRNSEEVTRYIALAEAFLVSSLREEQWGLVINESMASSVPVIASDICGATPELIEEGITGFSYSAGNHRQLLKHIIWCTENRPLLEKMGQSASIRVEKFSLDVFATNFLNIAVIANLNNDSMEYIPL